MRPLLFTLLLLISIPVSSQVRKVSGVYTYYSEPTQSPKDAFAAAIENARVKALAKEFGTIVSQNLLINEERHNDKETNLVMQLSMAEVKGEWLEDIREPETKILATMNDGSMVIEASVQGRARAIGNESVDFQALALRNGTEAKFASTNFKSGDNMYLLFNAPIDGYVAVYLVDEQKMANCLLPYPSDDDGQQAVEHGREYIFFSPKHVYDVRRDNIAELEMTCDEDGIEHNVIYVLFSPNPFIKAVDKAGGSNGRLVMPPQLGMKEFTRWMTKMCSRDEKMSRKMIHLVVTGK